MAIPHHKHVVPKPVTNIGIWEARRPNPNQCSHKPNCPNPVARKIRRAAGPGGAVYEYPMCEPCFQEWLRECRCKREPYVVNESSLSRLCETRDGMEA